MLYNERKTSMDGPISSYAPPFVFVAGIDL
jgi:hypothetical protein